MTSLGPVLNTLLESHKSKPIPGSSYSIDGLNDFLKEAYQIQSRINELLQLLISIRRPYLSTAPPPRQSKFAGSTSRSKQASQQHLSNAERDAIDNEAKAIWRDISATITRLSQAEKVRRDAEKALVDQRRRKKGFGALGSWAAGGAVQQKSPEEEEQDGRMSSLGACRESIIWFLNRGLEECGRLQSNMMEIRISRELEKNKSMLSQAQGSRLAPASETGATPSRPQQKTVLADEEAERAMSQQLSQEQMQLFAEENKNMLKYYEDQLGKVKAAEKSLIEISELQATLANNLQIQSAHIDQLVQDSSQTTQDVSKGNVELKRATQRRSTAKLVFWSSIGLCTFLVGWDLVI